MSPPDESARLKTHKTLASGTIVLWLVAVGLVSGPMRWEFQHTYAHWIGNAGRDLPKLTQAFALPVLGIGSVDVATVLLRCGFWAVVWLTPLVIGIRIWRVSSRLRLVEVLLLGGLAYTTALAALGSLLAFGLWLPFGLL